MKINKNIKIIGQQVILVPYEAKHVERYHTWMKSKELQALTASEPLTLEEEYDMQKSWRNDEDKCTFLILDKDKFEQTGNEIESLVGDTNFFLMDGEDSDTDETDGNRSTSPATPRRRTTAETEIMIAEPTARRKHFGWEAMLLMIEYGRRSVDCTRFVAKIGFANERSIRMFTKMQFIEVSRSEVFEEITFERRCTTDWLEWLQANIKYSIKQYNSS